MQLKKLGILMLVLLACRVLTTSCVLINANLNAKILVRFLASRQAVECTKSHINISISVTRLGEIFPIWQNFESIWHLIKVYLVVGKILNLLSLANFMPLYNFHCCTWPNIE